MKARKVIAVGAVLMLGIGGIAFLRTPSVTTEATISGDQASPAAAAANRVQPSKPTAMHRGATNGNAKRSLPTEPADIATNYAALAQLADSGDKEAAKTLYKATVGCDQAPITDGALEKRLSLIESGISSNQPDAARAILAQQARNEYERCKWFSSTQVDQWWHWLDSAVTADDETLLSEYYTREGVFPKGLEGMAAKRAYAEKVKRLLSESAESGSTSSILWLSDMYDRGALVDKDPVLAYAYLKAYMDISATSGGVSAFAQDNAKKRLSDFASRLTEEEMQQARTLAEQITHTN